MKWTYKIPLSFAAIIILLVAGNILSTSYALKQLQEERFKTGDVTLAKSMADRLFRKVIEQDTSELTNALFDEKQLREEKVEGILIFDRKGYLLSHTYVGNMPREFLNLNNAFGAEEKFRITKINIGKAHVYDIAVPIMEGITQIGAIHLVIKGSYIQNAVAASISSSLKITFVVALFSMIIAIMISRAITSPINKLTNTTAEISKGRLDARVEIPSRDEFGQLADSFNKMVRDLKSSNETLEEAKKEADAANRAKTDFLNTVSHELRTPLTSVLGFAKIIRKKLEEIVIPAVKTDDKKTAKALQQINGNIDIIVSEGERLTHLINDVLDLAKMEAGKISWNMQTVSMTGIVRHALAATASLFEHKGLKISTDIDEGLPDTVGDRDRLIQVVINLISNAVKFTERGSVTCSAKLRNGEILVSIADSGIGIAEEDYPKVFEKFKQVGDAMTDRPTGSGLGLPICKEIIEHHKGRIWVDSQLGVGSTFSFALPLTSPDLKVSKIDLDTLIQRLKEHVVAIPPSAGNEKNILIVDDDAAIREFIKQGLESEGYMVSEAINGIEGVKKAKKERPDLIVLDVMMPEMDGFDAAAILKNDPVTMSIPILILSVLEDRERGYRVGVDRYLTKPIEMDTLIGEIGALISKGFSKKKVMVVDEDESTVKALSELLETRGYSVAGACTGMECVNKAITFKPDMIILNRIISDSEDMVKTLRFEKGLENIYFVYIEEGKK